jgi:hypothetical protein
VGRPNSLVPLVRLRRRDRGSGRLLRGRQLREPADRNGGGSRGTRRRRYRRRLGVSKHLRIQLGIVFESELRLELRVRLSGGVRSPLELDWIELWRWIDIRIRIQLSIGDELWIDSELRISFELRVDLHLQFGFDLNVGVDLELRVRLEFGFVRQRYVRLRNRAQRQRFFHLVLLRTGDE